MSLREVITTKQSRSLIYIIFIAISLFLISVLISFYSSLNIDQLLIARDISEKEIQTFKSGENTFKIGLPQKSNYLVRIEGEYLDDKEIPCKITFNNNDIISCSLLPNQILKKEFVIPNNISLKGKNILSVSLKEDIFKIKNINIKNFRGYNSGFPRMVVIFKNTKDSFNNTLLLKGVLNNSYLILFVLISILFLIVFIVTKPLFVDITSQLKMIFYNTIPIILIAIITVLVHLFSSYIIIWDFLDMVILTFLPVVITNIFIGYKVIIDRNNLKYIKIVLISVFFIYISIYCFIMIRHIILEIRGFPFGNAHDFGYIHQAIWNAANGNTLYSTFYPAFKDVPWNLLGDHTHIFLLLLVPFYWIWPFADGLLILQSITIMLTGILLFIFSWRIIKSLLIACTIFLVFLVHPFVVTLFSGVEFRAIVFIMPFYILACYYLVTSKWIPLTITLLIAMTVQESVFAIVICFGIYILIFHFKEFRTRWFATGLICLALIYGVLTLKVIMPYFKTSHGYHHFVIIDPKILFDLGDIKYLHKLLFPLLYLPCLSPTMLLGIPNFIQNLICDATARDFHLWHSVEIIPIVFCAAILSISWLLKWNKISRFIVLLILLAMLISSIIQSKYLISQYGAFNLTKEQTQRYQDFKDIMKEIPQDASLRTQFLLLRQTSGRHQINSSYFTKPNDFILLHKDLFVRNDEKKSFNEDLVKYNYQLIKQVGDFFLYKYNNK